MQFARSLLALITLATVAAAPAWHGTHHPAIVDIVSTAQGGGVHGDGSPYVGGVDGTFEFVDRDQSSDLIRLAPASKGKQSRTISLSLDGQPHTCAWTNWYVADRSEDQTHVNWLQMTTAQLGARMWCGGERSEPTFQLTWTHRVASGPSSGSPIDGLLETPCVSATRDGDTWTFEAGVDCVVEVATWRRGAYRLDTTISQPFRFTAVTSG